MNESETIAFTILGELGGQPDQGGGYPDIVVTKDGEIVAFVEVKPHPRKKLDGRQERFKRLCERFGIPFLKWCPADGEAPLRKLVATVCGG